MSTTTARFFSVTVILGIIGSGFVMGCNSNGDEMEPQNNNTETSDVDTESSSDDPTALSDETAFDGTWRSDCMVLGTSGVPQDDQPDGYTQGMLTIDSQAGTYSDVWQVFTDSACSIEDPNRTAPRSSGQIQFEGTTTTSSGLEATVVRYTSNGGSPELVGLLYRDGDVLYRELRQSTLIEDVVPTELALSAPWRS